MTTQPIIDVFTKHLAEGFDSARPQVYPGLLADPDAFFGDREFDALLEDPLFRERLGFAQGQERPSFADKVTTDVEALCREGATAAIRGVQKRPGAVREVCLRLSEQTGLPFHAVAYLTPEGQGFKAHYDLESVLAVQGCTRQERPSAPVGGSKTWCAFKPVVSGVGELRLPWIRRRFGPEPDDLGFSPEEQKIHAEEHAFLRVRLYPGDALWLPRGWVHFAYAELGEPSLHLSIGAIHAEIDRECLNDRDHSC